MNTDTPQRLTFSQCLVGGYVGFGLLVGILCLMTGAGLAFWFVMTNFLTLAYTGYYYLKRLWSRSDPPHS